MITLEEVEHRLSEANEALKLYKEQQTKPHTLKEGKPIYRQLNFDACKEICDWSGFISCEEFQGPDGKRWCAVLRIDFSHREAALSTTRAILNACGGSTD